MPVSIPLHRFFFHPDFNGSGFSGAIVGRLSALSEGAGSGSTTAFALSVNLGGSVSGHRKALDRLRASGWVIKVGRGRFALSAAGADRVEVLIAAGRFQWYDPAEISRSITPKLAAVRFAFRKLRSVRVVAANWGLSRSTIYRLLAAAGISLRRAFRAVSDRIRDTVLTGSATPALKDPQRSIGRNPTGPISHEIRERRGGHGPLCSCERCFAAIQRAAVGSAV